MNNEYLKAAAEAVERQALENPGLGIPADPDVAEFMGCFVEKALSLDELDDDLEFSDHKAGEDTGYGAR